MILIMRYARKMIFFQRITLLHPRTEMKNLCTLHLFGDNLSKTDFCNFSEEVKNEQHTTRESGCNY